MLAFKGLSRKKKKGRAASASQSFRKDILVAI
jgi:hypothetical protein